MKAPYNDIVDKLGKPTWWDDHGVPRYCEPHPKHAPCIYSRQVLFFEIQCQACQTRFTVSMTGRMLEQEDLGELIKDHKIHYGDPPNFCCASGATMNSEPLRVVSLWQMDKDYNWKELEEFRDYHLA